MKEALASLVPHTRGGLTLAAVVLAGVAAASFEEILPIETRRVVFVLVTCGFFFAPTSSLPLRPAPFAVAAAAAGWGAQRALAGGAGPGLLAASAVLGSLVVVRAGERASAHWLPAAEGDVGRRQRAAIRRQLSVAVLLYLAVYLHDGVSTTAPGWAAWPRGAALFFAAAGFLRYLLLQARFLGLAAVPLLRPPDARGTIPSQRWPVLLLMALVVCTRLPDALLGWLGEGSEEALLVTSALLLVLAGLLFVLALVRLQRAEAWPRSLVRRASFFAGVALAVSIAGVYVEMEPQEPPRYVAFVVFCSFFLVVVPFVHASTGLLRPYPRASFLVAPTVLAVMSAPLTAVNGPRWAHASIGCLFALAVLLVLYSWIVAVREDARGKIYLTATFLVLAVAALGNGTAWSPAGPSFKVFLVAVSFVLYAADLLERAGGVAKG